MNSLFLLIPLGLILLVAAVAAFFWAVRSGQFDDLETPAWRIRLATADTGPAAEELEPQWHAPQPPPGRREQRVGECGRQGRQAGLADAAGTPALRQQVHGNLRCLRECEQAAGVEVALFHPAATDADAAVERHR
ncbi:MAG: cbb3-type cytochrome oxidase assembly protein CcoS [Proteobacteria bacterium]|nr:MAG: cbb3-type cytochrome oxidase assembly protein CcoS [Pseudomonadota bacterium]